MKVIDDLDVVYETDLLSLSGAERLTVLPLGASRWYVTYHFKSGMVYHEFLRPCHLALKSVQHAVPLWKELGTSGPESWPFTHKGETPMKPVEVKQKEAEARNALWAQLSPVEQLAKLNQLFPNGARAQKARLIARLSSGDEPGDGVGDSVLPAPLGAANIVPLPVMKKKDRKKARAKREELNEKRRKIMEKGGV
jgi:hypothetical protein